MTMLGAVTPEQLIPAHHPIRRIKPLVDGALQDLEPTLEAMYAKLGRPSIPPEHLFKACLLMALYSISGERQLCERLQYDLLFNWFLVRSTTPASPRTAALSSGTKRRGGASRRCWGRRGAAANSEVVPCLR